MHLTHTCKHLSTQKLSNIFQPPITNHTIRMFQCKHYSTSNRIVIRAKLSQGSNLAWSLIKSLVNMLKLSLNIVQPNLRSTYQKLNLASVISLYPRSKIQNVDKDPRCRQNDLKEKSLSKLRIHHKPNTSRKVLCTNLKKAKQ